MSLVLSLLLQSTIMISVSALVIDKSERSNGKRKDSLCVGIINEILGNLTILFFGYPILYQYLFFFEGSHILSLLKKNYLLFVLERHLYPILPL